MKTIVSLSCSCRDNIPVLVIVINHLNDILELFVFHGVAFNFVSLKHFLDQPFRDTICSDVWIKGFNVRFLIYRLTLQMKVIYSTKLCF